jgi:hypothetical protein
MKPQKVVSDGQALRLPMNLLKGDDALYQIQDKVNEVSLPSIKGEMMKAWGTKVFILDADRRSSKSPITIVAQGDDKINGESKVVINHNGGSLMLVPVSYNDWGCFYGVPAASPASKSTKPEIESPEPAISEAGK